MRVLAYIHTFNDAGVIEQAVDTVQRQTRQPDGIIVVDNASTDGTLDRTFPERIVVVRNSANLGTSGAVGVGFSYALAHGFDWVWVLDPDSVPEPDALERLLAFYEGLPPARQEHVFFVVSRVVSAGKTKHEPMVLTESGGRIASAEPGTGYSRCDCALWSGSLYRMAAVEKIGLPHPDYFADWSELEYGYRAQRLGFTSYMVHDAILHQDVGRGSGLAPRNWRLGPLRLELYDAPPLRCYYQLRNMIYFSLYERKPRLLAGVLRSIARCTLFTASFVVRPISHSRQLVACLRGIWHGLTGNIAARY
jgi:rhamnopyranosyl-N-acetylglucosaminyl-diphospho-decaprenol beta-1,3/1,4-galactofuranosyltransferase